MWEVSGKVQNVGVEVEEEEWKIDHGGEGLSIIMTKAKANW